MGFSDELPSTLPAKTLNSSFHRRQGAFSLGRSLSRCNSREGMPVVGVLLATTLTTGMTAQTIAALRKGLRDLGHLEGQNIVLELRSAGGKSEALGGLAEELVQLNAAVLCAFGPAAVRAASAATRTIPIVALDQDR